MGGSRNDDDDVIGLSKGALVFVRHGTDAWAIGKLLEKPSDGAASEYLVQVSDEGSPRRVAIRDMAPAPIDSSKDAENITSLSYLHLPAVIDCLRVRYERREIYTRAGPVLVAVNPFESLQGLYSPDVAARYAEAADEEARRNSPSPPPSLPPHIFETASRAYSAMVSTGKSQSIIISGESGAGKTESAKLALRQVAALAAAAAAAAASPSSSAASTASAAGDEFAALEAAILATNPVLEAFGNAKTSRNDNSSRFGKLVELLYKNKQQQKKKNMKNGHTFIVAGARLSTCLLERSRLVARPAGERNFHILYQLVAGASDELREELHLPPPNGEGEDGGENSTPAFFRYLSDGPSRIEGVDDAAEFRRVVEALSAVGVSSEEDQRALWRALAGVLFLGNVDFGEVNGGEACEVSKLGEGSSSSVEALATAASLLGVRAEELERVLTTRDITAGGGGGGGGGSKRKKSNNGGRRNSGSGGAGGGGDRVVKLLRREEAESSRDALAKAVYSSLFDWLVARINSTLAPEEGVEKSEEKEVAEVTEAAGDDKARAASSSSPPSSPSISLLDIYGFECFQENGFEQLCINYANEHLQARWLFFFFS